MNETKKKTISFSQMSMYNECQYKWYLNYIKKLGTGEGNIHTLFGSSMHSVLQTYLKTMYETSIKDADMLDLNKMLFDEMSKNFKSAKEANGTNICTKEELVEFYNDGISIIEFFKKNRNDYFNKKGYELVGIEIPLRADLPKNLIFNGYIDIAIRDTISGKIKIIDFKTSTRGWNDYQKRDDNKTSQILLYKKFYADKFDIPVDKIDVEFIILKRRLYENADFPQRRIQKYSPASGKPTITKTISKLNEFVNACFTSDGDFNLDRKFVKVNDEKKCKYCEFNKTQYCDRKIKE